MTFSHTAFVSAVGRATLAHPPCTSISRISSSSSSSTSFLPCRSRALPRYVRPHCTRYLSPQRHHSPIPVVASATQQETDWNQVEVTDVSKPCEAHTLLTLNVGVTFSRGSMTDSYRTPGMFLQLRPDLDAKPTFLAIASPPTITGIFEFLIKDSEATEWVTNLKQGDTIYSSPVMGKGFKYTSLSPPPDDVLLFATGSGIAPIRAAIESILNGIEPRKRRTVTLFYGARCPQRMAFTEKFEEWSSNGVTVVPVISRPEDADQPWEGRTGYIQHALDDLGVKDPQNTAALLCGVKGMTEEVRERLVTAGVPESNILLNF